MKTILLTLALLLTTNSFAMSVSEREKQDEVKIKKLIQVEALKTYELSQKMKQQFGLNSFRAFTPKKECEEDDDTSGSSCWDACDKAGWPTSYCSDKCGSDNSGEQEGCWEKCSKDGWPTSYCSDKCGSDTPGGENACFDKCTKDGWPFSYCTDKCKSGIN